MNHCTNQGHEDLSGNRDDPRRIVLANTLSQGCLLALGFLLSATLPPFWPLSQDVLFPYFTLSFSSLFFCLLIPSSSASLPFSLNTFQLSLLEMVPQPERLFTYHVWECHTGFPEIQSHSSQIGTSRKHQLMDLIRIKKKEKKWPLQPQLPSSASQETSASLSGTHLSGHTKRASQSIDRFVHKRSNLLHLQTLTWFVRGQACVLNSRRCPSLSEKPKSVLIPV